MNDRIRRNIALSIVGVVSLAFLFIQRKMPDPYIKADPSRIDAWEMLIWQRAFNDTEQAIPESVEVYMTGVRVGAPLIAPYLLSDKEYNDTVLPIGFTTQEIPSKSFGLIRAY